MMNVVAYSCYFSIVFSVIWYIGHYLYKNGRPLLLKRFRHDTDLALKINKLLLVGYYLINLGGAILAIAIWPDVGNFSEVLRSLFFFLCRLLLILGYLHYINLLIINILSKKYIKS